ncbi:MAG: hypothetical protein WB615_03745 [Candidatus Tumulicola sp.]
MYDPIRRIVPEYFGSSRAGVILERCAHTLDQKQFEDPTFDEMYRKSNRSALVHLSDLVMPGAFEDLRTLRASVAIGKFVVRSTVDFYAQFVPDAANGKKRSVGVIVYPSGIRKRLPEQRRVWAKIESEVAFRAAASNGIDVEEIMYVDLPRIELYRFKGPSKRLWPEIDATCHRIYRDWRDIRLLMDGSGEFEEYNG